MPKPKDGPDEAETLAALEEKRVDAIKVAVPQLLQIDREIMAKNKRKSEIYQGLEKRGITPAPFKEALRRARKNEEELDLFDDEAAALEKLIRQQMSGQLADADKSAARTAVTAEKAQTTPKAAKTKKESKPKAAAKKAAKKKPGETEAEPALQLVEPAGDPNFRTKIKEVHAEPGAEGLSANDIPMPGMTERPPQPPRQTGFHDKTPRMPASEARRLLNPDDDVLGSS